MARRGNDTWRIVTGNIRSAVFPEAGISIGMGAVGRVLPGAVLIWRLVEMIRGHRVTYMYTYQAEGKYLVGYTHRLVPEVGQSPRLFGKAVGETIYVRYNPSEPAVSVILSQDNPV